MTALFMGVNLWAGHTVQEARSTRCWCVHTGCYTQI